MCHFLCVAVTPHMFGQEVYSNHFWCIFKHTFLYFFPGVLVERRFSGKGSEDPAADFWWWSVHNWITHPVRRLPV